MLTRIIHYFSLLATKTPNAPPSIYYTIFSHPILSNPIIGPNHRWRRLAGVVAQDGVFPDEFQDGIEK